LGKARVTWQLRLPSINFEMYPVLFGIGTFEVTGLGVMVAVAALVGLWLFRRELLRAGLPPGAADAAIVAVIAIGIAMLSVARPEPRADFASRTPS
jgi:prolipoprotein diacylglyceryltransferase